MHKKTALITGVSSGIGEALTREWIKRGMNVIGIARSKEKLIHLSQELGESFTHVVCDICDKKQISKIFTFLKSQNITPCTFFLNAGIAGEQAVEIDQFNLQKHDEIMNINYFGVLNFIHEWKNNGMFQTHFIVTSSVNALWAPPSGSAYASSKAAISKAFEGLSLTFLESGTKFSSLYCGPVQTKGLKGKVPFAWSPEKMAVYMADFAQGKKEEKISFPVLLSHLPRLKHVAKSMGVEITRRRDETITALKDKMNAHKNS